MTLAIHANLKVISGATHTETLTYIFTKVNTRMQTHSLKIISPDTCVDVLIKIHDRNMQTPLGILAKWT